jgi:hypothetical protein
VAWHAVRASDAAGPLISRSASALRAAVIYPLLPPVGLRCVQWCDEDPAANSEKGALSFCALCQGAPPAVIMKTRGDLFACLDEEGLGPHHPTNTSRARGRGYRIAALMSPIGSYCRKSRKSNNAKNLANGDSLLTPPLQYFVAPIRSSVIVWQPRQSLSALCGKADIAWKRQPNRWGSS